MRREIIFLLALITANVCFGAPIIDVEPIELNFSAIEGASNPPAQILYINNGGTGKLEWQTQENCTWLNVEPNSGSCISETDEALISINIEDLTDGNYSCQLLVSDEDADNSPQIIEVNLYITGPILEVSHNYYEFCGIEGGFTSL